MLKPGYKTTEHLITWAVIILGTVALFKGRNSIDRLAALIAPAIASASYSQARGRAKSSVPLDPAESLTNLRNTLEELFRGRVVK